VPSDDTGTDLEGFRAAGRTLFSLGLIRGTEGNLSTLSGQTLVITRTGAPLDRLSASDLIEGSLEGPLPDASSDLVVHRSMYAEQGPGAIAHSHPAGTVPEGEEAPAPGGHGLFVFAPTLEEAVERTAERVRGLESA
jgi:ribulose-5-phosphate 4-epimerase/fuculose-1-phosphate aldolase